MPIFEFVCDSCGVKTEELFSEAVDVMACPICGNQAKRVPSCFKVPLYGKERNGEYREPASHLNERNVDWERFANDGNYSKRYFAEKSGEGAMGFVKRLGPPV